MVINFIEILSQEERKELIDAASRKNDLLPTLPPEILIIVFSHLPVQDSWTFQRVNRRWRDALSSEQLLRTALLRWNTHDPSDSGRPLSDIANDLVRHRILHQQSLKFGKPFSIAEFDDTGTGLQGPQPQLSHRKLDLKGKNIGYISSKPGEGEAVIFRDLGSGSVHTYHGEARERIITLALSTELLAFVTFDGYLHVVKLSDPARHSRHKLPSANVRAFGVDASVIAIAMGKSGVPHLTQLLLFDASSGRFKELDVEKASRDCFQNIRFLNSFSLLVDSRGKTIDIFSLALHHERRDVLNTGHEWETRFIAIVHFRLDFEGVVSLPGGAAFYQLEHDEPLRTSHLTMAPPVPTGLPNQFRIQVGETRLLGGLPIRVKMDRIFHTTNNLEGFDEVEPEDMTPGMSYAETRPKRREIADSPYLRDGRFWHHNVHARWKHLAVRSTTHQSDSDWLEYCSLMNDTFLVSLEVSAARMQHSRVRVFCFDPEFDLHGGRSTGFWEDGKLLPKYRWYDAYSEMSSRTTEDSAEDSK